MALRHVRIVLRATAVCLLGLSACTWVVWQGRSPNRRFPIVVCEKSGRQFVLRDGKSDPVFDGIAVEGIVFSADGQHLAYPARRGGRWCVVVDGSPGPFWEGIGLVQFGPKAKIPVYAGFNHGQWQMIVGGCPEQAMDSILSGSLVFSPDGKHVAYAGTQSESARVIRDGTLGAAYDGLGRLAFSRDSQHLMYVARLGFRVFVVMDGQEGPAYEEIAEPMFDPLGTRLAYAAKIGREWFVVFDEKRGPGFDAVKGLTFDPSGRRFGYIAIRDGLASVILDGTQGQSYEQILPDSLRFSPDGQRFAFVAVQAHRMAVVVDGEPGLWSEQVSNPVFHPCGGELLYVENSQGKSRLVVEGVPGPEWDWVGQPTFGFGCRLGFLVGIGKRMRILVDNQEFEVDMAIEGTLVFSDDGKHWACLAGDRERKELFMIIDTPKTRRPFDWEELVGEIQRFPKGSLDTAQATLRLRQWIRAELELCLISPGEKREKRF